MKAYRTSLAIPALLLAAWYFGVPAPRAAEVEKNLEQSFAVKPGAKLVIDADRGSIDVTVGAGDTIAIKVLRKAKANTAARAEEILAKHEVRFAHEGNTVTVKARLLEASRNWFRRGANLYVRYEAVVPRELDPDLTTAGGSIHVGDLAGTVRARTAGGSVKVGRTEGAVWANTAGGSIEIESATGLIEAATAGGNITVGEGGARVETQTAGGSIHLGTLRGAARARTSGGSIRIDEAAGRVEASTSGGSIRAALSGTPEEDCRLETSAGSIDLALPASVSATIDAATSAGSVTCDLPVTVQGKVKRDSLQGKLGDGGKLLKLRTSAGSIRIKART